MDMKINVRSVEMNKGRGTKLSASNATLPLEQRGKALSIAARIAKA